MEGGPSYQGGLYPGGSNDRPPEHDADGVWIAGHVVPRADGEDIEAVDGKIGFVCLGDSASLLIFQSFLLELASPPAGITPNPRMVACNAAQFSSDLFALEDPNGQYWRRWVPQQLAASFLHPRQVQAVWIMSGSGTNQGPFPNHAIAEANEWIAVLQNVLRFFPNCRLAFITSHHYSNYCDGPPLEPYVFEQAWGVKWAIEKQIEGDPRLSYRPSMGPIIAPWTCWAGYPWCDGVNPRSDGLEVDCDDFAQNGTHPNPTGAAKLRESLWTFCTTDPVATPWFLTGPADTQDGPHGAHR